MGTHKVLLHMVADAIKAYNLKQITPDEYDEILQDANDLMFTAGIK